MVDAWFCFDETEAVIFSKAFPAAEIDLPDCNEFATNERGTVYCTRATGHGGRHLAAVPGTLGGFRVFAVVAAWPGVEKPERLDSERVLPAAAESN